MTELWIPIATGVLIIVLTVWAAVVSLPKGKGHWIHLLGFIVCGILAAGGTVWTTVHADEAQKVSDAHSTAELNSANTKLDWTREQLRDIADRLSGLANLGTQNQRGQSVESNVQTELQRLARDAQHASAPSSQHLLQAAPVASTSPAGQTAPGQSEAVGTNASIREMSDLSLASLLLASSFHLYDDAEQYQRELDNARQAPVFNGVVQKSPAQMRQAQQDNVEHIEQTYDQGFRSEFLRDGNAYRAEIMRRLGAAGAPGPDTVWDSHFAVPPVSPAKVEATAEYLAKASQMLREQAATRP